MSFNYLLLSRLTENTNSGADNLSIQKRYRSLSIIYLNLFQIMVFFLYFVIDVFVIPVPGRQVPLVCIPLMMISLMFLKMGKDIAAACSLLGAFHIGIFICGFFCDISIGALIATTLLPGLSFLVTSSSTLHSLNFIICLIQIFGNIFKINQTFGVLFTTQQEGEITATQIFSVFTLITHWLHNYLTKNLEAQLLHNVDINYSKAANITKELVEALSAKENFVSSLSHEIRNPLNSLNGSINHLLTIIKDPNYIEILRNAKLSGDILLNLVSNVIDVAKLKSEKIELKNFETDPVDAIQKVLTINTENLKNSQVSVKAFISKNIPPLVWIDSGRFLQILMNLVSNAIKFNRQKGEIKVYMKLYEADVSPEILNQPIESNPFSLRIQRRHTTRSNTMNRSIETLLEQESPMHTDIQEDQSNEFSFNESKDRNANFNYFKGKTTKSLNQVAGQNPDSSDDSIPWIILRKDHLRDMPLGQTQRELSDPSAKKGIIKVQVSDNGCGVPENMIPKLFDMFAQSYSINLNGYRSAGLGLWISKQLCQKMGGDINIHSKEDQGTTFVFHIPVNIGSTVETSQQPSNISKQPHVLVVDDYPFNRNLHRLILEREGARVTLASDGLEALKEYTKQSSGYFDFIMMDVQMPNMDGFTAAKKIREFEYENKWKHVDICFVSGEYYDESEVLAELRARERVTEMAQMRCMKKPIDIEVIKKMVESCSKRREEAISRLNK